MWELNAIYWDTIDCNQGNQFSLTVIGMDMCFSW